MPIVIILGLVTLTIVAIYMYKEQKSEKEKFEKLIKDKLKESKDE